MNTITNRGLEQELAMRMLSQQTQQAQSGKALTGHDGVHTTQNTQASANLHALRDIRDPEVAKEMKIHAAFQNKAERVRNTPMTARRIGVRRTWSQNAKSPAELYALLGGDASTADNELSDHADNLERQMRNGAALDEWLEEQFPDPLRRHLVLKEAFDRAENAGDDDKANTIAQKLDSLWEKSEKKIQAGLNTIEAAAEYSRKPEVQNNFRDLYYDVVMYAPPSPSTFLEKLLEQLRPGSADQFTRSTNQLIKAVGQDMRAMNQSTDLARLHLAMRDIELIATANTMLVGIEGLLKTIEEKAKKPPPPLHDAALMLIRAVRGQLFSGSLKKLLDDLIPGSASAGSRLRGGAGGSSLDPALQKEIRITILNKMKRTMDDWHMAVWGGDLQVKEQTRKVILDTLDEMQPELSASDPTFFKNMI